MSTPGHRLLLLAALGVAGLAARPAPASVAFGSDFANGSAAPLVDEIRAEIAAIVAAAPDARPALIDALIARRATTHIEGLKRVRNPELLPLWHKLLTAQEWELRHRALFVLEHFGDASVLPVAWGMISDPEPRVRERAIIFVIKMWNADAARGIADPVKHVRERLRAEDDLHLRRCLEALEARIAGKLHVERVHTEFTVKGDDGVILVPVLDGMDKVGAVAPGYSAKPDMRQGGSSAMKCEVADRWTTPLFMWNQEPVSGAQLQPFANPRGNGVVHTGQDVGASLEGAGFYALATGVVRFVHTGSDMGTLIVTEHRRTADELVNSVYMHGGDTVFVKAGDEIRCGQLLGTMGMGFSIENGGHYAHLHHGLYPGEFQVTHNYGYKNIKDGLGDWFDPAVVLPEWMASVAPPVDDLPPLHGDLDKALGLVDKGAFAKAHAAATKIAEGEGEAAEDARRLVTAIEAGPTRVVARAAHLRATGYPSDAQAALAEATKAWKGVPGAGAIDEAQAALDDDEAFAGELAAEKELAAAEAMIAKLKPKERAARELEVLEALAGRHAATSPVGARIAARLTRARGK